MGRPVAGSRAFVALGGNVGNVLRTFGTALRDMMRADMRVTAVSSAYRTEPERLSGADESGSVPDYWNAVCVVDTSLAPQALLDALLRIEAAGGRTRPHRWAPRTLDLDLLVHGDRVIDEPRLTLPHPRLADRPFVLQPLLELVPYACIPGWGATVAELVRRHPNPQGGIHEVRSRWIGQGSCDRPMLCVGRSGGRARTTPPRWQESSSQ